MAERFRGKSYQAILFGTPGSVAPLYVAISLDHPRRDREEILSFLSFDEARMKLSGIEVIRPPVAELII
jgi:hypothetical protein